ncbi:MAG: hypothetical protein U1F17_12930 [Burkholderiaceae bacterium]
MNPVRRRLSALTLLACATGPAAVSAADTAAAPEVARFFLLVGHWKGHGELTQSGQAPARLTLDYRCRKAAASSAVSCELKARNGTMSIAETDLFGVDPVRRQGHWYAVTNQGESHDHLVEWTDARTMKARYAWTQDGAKMEENIAIRFDGARSMNFRSVVTADGNEAAVFGGTLRR